MNRTEAVEFYIEKRRKARGWATDYVYRQTALILSRHDSVSAAMQEIQRQVDSPIDPRLRAIYRLTLKELLV